MRRSISRKLILVPLLVLFAVMGAGHLVSAYLLQKRIADNIRALHYQNTEMFHRFVEVAQRKSMEYYLKGIAENYRTTIAGIEITRDAGRITDAAAERNIRASIINQRIGRSGYTYIIDSTGIVRHHPFSELEGVDLNNFDFVKEQLRLREGYLEYDWANPGEPATRPKALYMVYYEPRDWIVSITAYRDEFADLINPADLQPFLVNVPESGEYSFLLDETGEHVVAPGNGRENQPDALLVTEVIRAVNGGRTEGALTTDAPVISGSGVASEFVHYSLLPDLSWILVSVTDKDVYKGFLSNTLLLNSLISLFSVVLTSLIFFWLGRSIAKRISRLHKVVSQELIEQIPIDANADEITDLEMAIRNYQEQIHIHQESLESMARFVEDSPMPILQIDKDGYCIFANHAANAGLTKQLFDSDNCVLSNWRHRLARCVRGETGTLTVGNDRYIVSTSGKHTRDTAYLAFFNISDADRYATLQSIWNGMFDHSIEGIAITDDRGKIERVNESFSRITGYSAAEAVGMHSNVLKSGVHSRQFYTEMWDSIGKNSYWEGEIWNRRKNGEIYPEWISITGFDEKTSGKHKYMAIFHDITRIKNQERLINRLESTDGLTGLPNRERFSAILDERLSAHVKNGDSGAVVVIHIDEYSRINSSLGVPTGDAVLRGVSSTISEVIRDNDHLARLGEDDFGLILWGFSRKTNKIEVMDRIQKALENGIHLDDRVLRVSISSGVAFVPEDGTDLTGIMANAYAALYRARKSARGSYVVFNRLEDAIDPEDLEQEFALRNALPNKEFYLEYQPIVSADDQVPKSFEALIRWRKGGTEVIPPSEFIPIAEATGLVTPIGRWVISEACRMIATFPPENAPRIAVNISAQQFSDPTFIETLLRITDSYGISPNLLTMEITEHVAAADTRETIRLLNQISSEGFGIAIDDFGTGYSSLKYIRDYRFDYLKIDKSFVENIHTEKGAAVLKAIISMGKSLGKSIIAEGVENQSEYEKLKAWGCDYIQGYYMSRPLSEENAVSFWKKSTMVEYPVG